MTEMLEPPADGDYSAVQYGALLSVAQRFHRDVWRAICGAVLAVTLFRVFQLPIIGWRLFLAYSLVLVAGAFLGWCVFGRNRWNVAVISKDIVYLNHENRRAVTVFSRDVLIVQGEAGFTRERDIIDWKFIRLTTSRGNYLIWLHPADCQDCYEHVLQVCSQALGVSYHCDIRIPPSPSGWTASQWLDHVTLETRRVLRKQIVRLMALALGCATVTTILVLEAIRRKSPYGVVWALVCFVLAIMFPLAGAKRLQLGRRAIREIRRERIAIEESVSPFSDYAGRIIAGAQPIESHRERADRRRAIALALLAFFGFCVPGLNMLLAGWSYYYGRRTTGWPRHLSIAALVVCAAVNLLAIALVIWHELR